MIRVF